MTHWGTRYNLRNLRTLRRDDPYWKETHAYLRLVPEMAIRIEDYVAQPPWEQSAIRAAAVGLSADRLVLAGKSAARLHGIQLLGWDDPHVELLCVDGVKPRGKAYRVRGTKVRSVFLPEDQTVAEKGVRLTRIMRTLRDVAAWHGVLEGVVAMDSALRVWPGLTLEKLRDELLSGPPYAGRRRVRQALEMAVSNSGSPRESHARYLLVTAKIPGVEKIEVQAEVVDPVTGEKYYVDFLINGWLVLEIDGRVKYDGVTYGGTEETILAERDREKAIQNTGRTVRRTSDPEEAVALVREAFAAREREAA